MQAVRHSALAIAAATLGVVGLAGVAHAVTIDGTLDSASGYVLASTQTQATNSNYDSNGGPEQLPATDATSTTVANSGGFTQLSNVYTQYDSASNTLNMFIGGSFNPNDGGVAHYVIALQTGTGGVSSLANQLPNGSVYQVNNPGNTNLSTFQANDSLDKITFDTGFTPTGLLIVQPNVPSSGNTSTGTGPYSGFTDLTGGSHTTNVTVGYNNSLQNIPVGTGAAGDPGFAGASTGTEISIPLSTLGYTPGTAILAQIFTLNGGNDGRTNNQVLAPFTPNPADDSGGYDYTYIDSQETVGGVNLPGRQFSGVDYPGQQFFVVPGTAATPEPASLGLLGLAGLSLLGRRSRRS